MQSHCTNNIFISKSRVIANYKCHRLYLAPLHRIKKPQLQQVARVLSVLGTGYVGVMVQPPPAAQAASSSLCTLFLPGPASVLFLWPGLDEHTGP